MSWLKKVSKVLRKIDPVGKALTDKTKGKLDPLKLYKDPKQAEKEAAEKAKKAAAAEAAAASKLVAGGAAVNTSTPPALGAIATPDPDFMDSEIFGIPAPVAVGVAVVAVGLVGFLIIKKA